MKMKTVNMRLASLIMLIISVIMVMVMQLGVQGYKNFNVGGTLTWRVPDANDTSFFDHWASSKRFHVGDSLHFEYQNDSVMAVEKYGYYHCKTSKYTSYHDDGNTYIKLERTGLSYFISGIIDHCRNGQRLAVDVMSAHSSPVAAPTPEPQDHQAGSPTWAPAAAETHKSGAALTRVHSAFLGLVVATSLFLV